MSEITVACSTFSGKIYAGKPLKNGMWSSKKVDVTDSAVSAVAQHFIILKQKMQFNYRGNIYEIKVTKIGE